MFSHVMFGCRDIKRSVDFYDALLAPLGITRRDDGENLPYACWVTSENSTAKFFVCLPLNEADAAPGNGNMVAFNATSTASVDVAYRAGLSLGGTDEGPPGPRHNMATATTVPTFGIPTATKFI